MGLSVNRLLLVFLFVVIFGHRITAEQEEQTLQRVTTAPRRNAGGGIDGSGTEHINDEMGEQDGNGRVSVSTVAIFTLEMAAATGLGALPFFFMELDPQWAGICNGMAAGAMLVASFDLIQERQGHGSGGWVVICILSGGVFIWLCNLIQRPLARGDEKGVSRLQVLMETISLRRTKEKGLVGLPSKSIEIFFVDLHEEERRVYDQMEEEAKKIVKDYISNESVVRNYSTVLSILVRLRQICTDLALCPADLRALLPQTQIEDASPSSKSIVFSQFQKMLLLLEEPLKGAGFKVIRLDGSMNAKKRSQVIKDFGVLAPEGPTIMLASLKASNAGINLTAASTMYLLEPWWNPAIEEQSMDRVHRIGQKHDVKVVRLIARDTIDERILQLQEKKRMLAKKAFGRRCQKDQREINRGDLTALMNL